MRENGNQLSVSSQSRKGSLLMSNEELRFRNEELIGLNIQLQKTLERQRAISSHLQNLLYSADVAAVFLDSDLNIRLFTPATTAYIANRVPDLSRETAISVRYSAR